MARKSGAAASPPSMLPEHETERAGVQPVYIAIVEQPDGFRWQVRGHELRDPLNASDEVFACAEAAREAGRATLDKVCRQFRRNGLAR